jgi:hypothetical protein
MDRLSFHPYPNRATDPLDRGYAWPNAGFVDLDRIKQALWDAFAGTPQPTTVDGLTISLDEVGWQVDTSRRPGYEGAANVPVTDERTQAAIYAELVRRAACDPDVGQVNFFGFYDDGARAGFQAGLHRVDGAPRPAADAVRRAIADGQSSCAPARPWRPTTTVLGTSTPRVHAVGRLVTLVADVDEGALVRACVLPLATSRPSAIRALARSEGEVATCRQQRAVPGRPARVVLRRTLALARGGTVAVRVIAEANASRAVEYVTRFR